MPLSPISFRTPPFPWIICTYAHTNESIYRVLIEFHRYKTYKNFRIKENKEGKKYIFILKIGNNYVMAEISSLQYVSQRIFIQYEIIM